MTDQPTNRPPPAVPASELDLTPWGFPRLKTCPKCEYSLVGLPAPHRCPECGLEYDEFSCEWENRRWRRAGRVLGVLGLVVYCVVLLAYFIAVYRSRFEPWLCLSGVLLVFLAYRLLPLFARGRRFIALCTRGIYARTDTIGIVFIPWQSFQRSGRFDPGRTGWEPMLFFRRRGFLRRLGLRDVLSPSVALHHFADVLAQAQRHYAGRPEGDGAHG